MKPDPNQPNPHGSSQPDPYSIDPHANSARQAPVGDDNMWAVLSHLAMLVLGIIGPLIIMLVKKDQSKFVEHHAKEALNFQISVLILQVATLITCIGPLIVAIGAIVYAVLAAIETNKGNYYRYPYSIRLIK